MKLSTIFLYRSLFIFLKYSLLDAYKFVPYYDIEKSYEPPQFVDFDLLTGNISEENE